MSRFDRFVGFNLGSDTSKADIAGTLREAGALGIGNGTGTFGSSLSYASAGLGQPMNITRVEEIAKQFTAARIADLRGEEAAINTEHAHQVAKMDLLRAIIKAANPEGRHHLSVPESSLFHSAVEALAKKRMFAFNSDFKEAYAGFGSMPAAAEMAQKAHCFLIEHDWAKVFEKSDVDDGEVHLPYEMCVFEFVLNGVHVCLFCEEGQKEMVLVKSGKEWGAVAEGGNWPYLTKTVRSVCIALDAEVAKTNVIRAPHKLNHARARVGKLPIFDHHVVSLMRRDRPERFSGGEPGTRKRLHWRRGHWRHYAEHKTWLKWMLVGDPDLGFVDKHYRL